MKTKEQKKVAIDALAKALPSSTMTVFTTFARAGESGLSVGQMEVLKRALLKVDGEYVVAKKTLVQKALTDLNYDGVDVFGMDGSMGLVLGHGDAFAVAKVLFSFAKENPALKLYAAWMDGRAVSHTELIDIATLPSRDELLARLLGMLKYPLSSLAVVLNQVALAKGADAATPAEELAPVAETEAPATVVEEPVAVTAEDVVTQ